MGMGAAGFGDEFDGLHDMEDDDIQSSNHKLSHSKLHASELNVEYDPDADQKKDDERE